MNKKIFSVLVALTLVFGFGGIALANDGALADFNTHYTNAGATYSCNLCHLIPPGTPTLNPYGTALLAQPGVTGSAIPDAAFLAVENADSDGDTFSNLDEITAGSLPGYSNDVPPPVGGVINITSPNGGEVIPSGLPFPITYDASDNVASVKVRYSLNGGVTWFIADDAGGSVIGSFNWAVPTPKKNKTKALVKVIGFTGPDGTGTRVDADRSLPFTIETVTITSPTTTDTLTGGGSFPITWVTNGTSAAVDSFELFYSTNNGLTWKRIFKSAAGSGDPGTYTWDNTSLRPIPSPANPKPKSFIRLLLKDSTGATVGTDVSNKFTIQ